MMPRSAGVPRMPGRGALDYLRGLTHPQRTDRNNLRLGRMLALVAGAVNAGGFLVVGQYTSHMSGIVSALADNLAAGEMNLALAGAGAFIAFLSGAASSAVLINWGRRRQAASAYALPLLLEAALLLCFGLFGAHLEPHRLMSVSLTVALLCYVMGLQNAIITKISHAEIRTTHVTGMVTDIGIELGKLLYWNVGAPQSGALSVTADRRKLALLASLLGMFLAGGLIGALGFRHVGFVLSVPLAALLVVLAAVPVLDDLCELRGRRS